MYYLALDYGYEGWSLKPYDSLDKMIEAIKDGETYGNKWKAFRELEVIILVNENNGNGSENDNST